MLVGVGEIVGSVAQICIAVGSLVPRGLSFRPFVARCGGVRRRHRIKLPPDPLRRGLLLRRPWIWVESVLGGAVVAAAAASLWLLFRWSPFRVGGVSSVTDDWMMDFVQEVWCGQLFFADHGSSSAPEYLFVLVFLLSAGLPRRREGLLCPGGVPGRGAGTGDQFPSPGMGHFVRYSKPIEATAQAG